MFPEDFTKRIRTQKYIDPESLLRSLEEPSPVSIRTNPGKWMKTPLYAEPVSWCKSGFYLDSRPSFTLDPLFHAGCYYPREASGMFMDQVFEQLVGSVENIRVLDLCAAPGGKSTQLSDLIGDSGVLISNEVIKSRSSVLAETIIKWGKGNTIVTQNDASDFSALHGYFDTILIDAPCSGEGMFRDKIAIDEWSTANTRLCEARQKRLISEMWPLLKENGLLVYSTCTFNPGENEENINWLIKKNEAVCLQLNINSFKGITEIDFNGVYGYGFYPGKIRGEGFFISVIRKTSKQDSVRPASSKMNEFKTDKNDLATAEKWCIKDPARFFKRGEDITALACPVEEYMFLFRNLTVRNGGTQIATRKKNDFLPSHELALSGIIRKSSFPIVDLNYADAIAYLRRDNFSLPDLDDSWNLITFKGVNLGFVKNICKRFNNYFPVEWRIRMNMPEPGKENIIQWD
ncbi:MAG TPA: rRNA cytosine-C5-methyltransferase [Bacteroidales bacterium]|nr:rRNA cytosine-C5-methyltransferase [Bacteroidales bacterium]